MDTVGQLSENLLKGQLECSRSSKLTGIHGPDKWPELEFLTKFLQKCSDAYAFTTKPFRII